MKINGYLCFCFCFFYYLPVQNKKKIISISIETILKYTEEFVVQWPRLNMISKFARTLISNDHETVHNCLTE